MFSVCARVNFFIDMKVTERFVIADCRNQCYAAIIATFMHESGYYYVAEIRGAKMLYGSSKVGYVDATPRLY